MVDENAEYHCLVEKLNKKILKKKDPHHASLLFFSFVNR